MIRVLVDLLFFTGKKGGMETYVRETYRALGAQHHDLEFVGLACTEFLELDHSWFPGEIVDAGISGEDRVAWARGELSLVARAAREQRADVIHAPANIGPWRSSVPVVLTVHDLLSFRLRRFPSPFVAAVMRRLVALSARAASLVVTDSEASASDIRRFLRVPDARVRVVPLAGSSALPGARRGSDRPLILSTGNRMPHKNFETLIRAVAALPREARPDVVITGSHGDDPLRPLVDELDVADSVTLAGWLTTEELDALWARATVYAAPSLFEGFGLPVLDAMNRGVAVLCSEIPVFREIGGDVPTYVAPTDSAAWSRAIVDLLADESGRAAAVERGLARGATYSWEACAEQTAVALVDAADHQGRSL